MGFGNENTVLGAGAVSIQGNNGEAAIVSEHGLPLRHRILRVSPFSIEIMKS